MKTATIFEAYSNYLLIESHKNKKSMLLSAIARFLIDVWGGECPKGDRASTRELINAEEFMKTLPVNLLIDSLETLEKFYLQKGKTKKEMRSYKSEYKSFITWVETNNYYTQKVEQLVSSTESNIPLISSRLRKQENKTRANYHKKTIKQPYSLMALYNTRGKGLKGLRYPNDYINQHLARDISLYEKFRANVHNCAPATIRKDLGEMFRMLGWLHRFKGIALEELRLSSIIYFTELNISITDFIDKKGKINHHKYFMGQAIARQEAVILASDNIKLIEEFCNFVGGHPKSRLASATMAISVAKFVFRNEIGTNEYVDDSDLPIVRKLNQLCNTFNKKAQITPATVPYENKSIPFEEALETLETLRIRCDTLTTQYVAKADPKSRNKERLRVKERTDKVVYQDLQLFLSLAFMLLIPTDRARTYYQLEMNKTFVYGFHKDGRFTPIESLQDKSQATWYIHLQPDEYKTGKTYKEYWGIMPNVPFKDGKSLYQYIDKWISEGRNYEQMCDHNYFFRKHHTYQPLHSNDFGNRIRHIFIQFNGMPVSPKEIRKMYVTWLNNKGATNAELKGAAFAMHQSQKMQESTYNCQTSFDKLVPIMQLNERMWKEVFGLSSDTD